jgi:carbon-monoxide dehydrogenase medium subunit
VYSFNYVKAKSLREVSDFLKANPDARPLAGGMTLIPTLKARLAQPTHLVDIAGLQELRGIDVKGGNLVIGAGTRHYDVAKSQQVRDSIPALSYLAQRIGDPQVRNCGTLGGSVANNDPAADYPAGVLGLGAAIHTNKRKIPADDFFTGMYETALQPGEIITSISFPLPQRAGYAKFKNPASRYAIVGVFVAETAKGVRVAVTGAAPCVFRVAAMEKALGSKFSADAVASIKVAAAGLNSDMHASAEYRAHLVTVMAGRAVEGAK